MSSFSHLLLNSKLIFVMDRFNIGEQLAKHYRTPFNMDYLNSSAAKIHARRNETVDMVKDRKKISAERQHIMNFGEFYAGYV